MGNIVSTFVYEFKRDYYFSVRGYTGGSDFTKETNDYQNLEIEETLDVIDEYVKAMTYAVAYTVKKTMSPTNEFIISKLDAICEKLGVETSRRNNSSSGFNSTSYFNGIAGSGSSESISYPSATIDDID